MFFSTSDNYDQSDIVENYGLVDSTIVIGANIFRDVFAGLRDIVGGETKGYKKDLDKLKNAVEEEIKIKASKLGANAIIAIKVDMDEISGGGKSMFMYQMIGTAVKLKDGIAEPNSVNKAEVIDFDDFTELRKRVAARNRIINEPNKINNFRVIIEKDWWDEDLYRNLVNIIFDSNRELIPEDIALLSAVPPEFYIDIIKADLATISKTRFFYCIESMKKHNWFNVNDILEILKSESYITRFRGLHFIYFNRLNYSIDDLNDYKVLLYFLNNNFDKSITTENSKGVFGSKEVHQCVNCLVNRPKDEGKSCPNCGANFLGFREENIQLKNIYYKILSIINTLEFISKE
ncbi:MAG: YbjQ family protein [Balneolaceae bacterium]|nr:YbjQ family protein [Balneolaceae bacterium]